MMQSRLKGLLLVCSTLWVAAVPARAQNEAAPAQRPASQPTAEEEDEFFEESTELLVEEIPMVVTAARREQKITTVPYAVSVITAEDIRRSGARSIPDALRLVPGMDVADLSFGNAAVSPRGLHGFVARQLLVLVDGRQIFDSLFGGTLWGSWPFQLEDVERIEVIRGPGGVTWGANAVNGVVNIITKDPREQQGLTFTAGGGSLGWHKEHLAYAFADDKLRFRVSSEYEAGDGFRRGGSILRNLEDDYRGGRVGVHALYEAGADDAFTFSAGNGLLDGGYSPPPTAGIGQYRNSGSRASFVLGRWAHQVAEHNRFELTGYVNDFQASNGMPAIDYRYQQFALQFSHTFKPAAAHTLTWGIDSRADLLDAGNSDPFMLSKDFVSTAVIGLYLQDEWRFAERWVLSLGGRIDYEFYGGFQPSARAALAYEVNDDSMVYGAVSRAFQMPPAPLRFLDIPLLNSLARVKGHRELDALSLLAYELGYRGKFFDRLEATVNVFWHEYDEGTTITPFPGPPGLMRIDLNNRTAFSVYGVELDAKYRATKELMLLGHYTYQYLNWKAGVPFHESDAMTPPKHKFMVGARYSPTADLHLGGHLYWVDAVRAPNPALVFIPRHIDPYFRLDLNAEYEFWDDRASVAVGVRNLLDNHHYEGGTLFLNDAEVSRMIYAEFKLRIK